MKITILKEKRNLIGCRLKQARIEKGLTQQDLCAKLQTMGILIDRASISKIEQQKRIVTDYELLYISQVLELSPNWLLGQE